MVLALPARFRTAVLLACLAGALPLHAQTPTDPAATPSPAAATAGAQTPVPPPAPDLSLKESVEVTGTRGLIESGKSPVSSSVVTRRDIESRNVRTVEQAVNALEGVAAYRTRGVADNGAGIGMRGFSGRSSGQSRVLVLLDGQPINDAYLGAVDWATVPIDEVDRVEVARGPFSSLYGGNAMGGVVNILTRPIVRRSAEVFLQQGTYGTGSYSGRFADRLGSRLGLSLSYAHLRTDGYPAQVVTRTATASTPTAAPQVAGLEAVRTATGGSAFTVGLRGDNFYRQHAFRGRLEYTVGPQTILSGQYIRQSKTTGWGPYSSSVRDAAGQVVDSGAGGLVFLDGDVWRRFTLLPSQFLGARQGGASNTYQGQLLRLFGDRGQLRVQAGVVDTPLTWTTLPGTSATQAGGAGTYTDQSFRSVFGNAQWTRSLGRHDLAVGTDVRTEGATVIESPTLDFLAESPLPQRNTFSNGRAFTQGVYVQDRINLGERVSVTAGGRFDAWRTYDGATQSGPTQPLGTRDDRSATATTGKISALYAPASSTAIRASVGTAFRNPSLFEMYRDLLDAGIFLLGNPSLEPERLLAVEGGVRQTLGVVTVDAAVYRNRITNLIYRATDFAGDPTGLTRVMRNAGEGTTRGVELGVGIRPLPWLTARPTYTFTDAVISRNPQVPATEGKQVPFVPRHASALTLSAARDRWTATLTTRYQADVFSTDTNTDVVSGVPGSYESFVEADVSVSVMATSAIAVILTGENLFDNRYFMFYRNPGRMLHAGVRVRF